jgi:transcriptional regulator with XRE-family HTH domain
MIKNDTQAKRAHSRLKRIRDEQKRLEEKYRGIELEFWAGSLRDDAAKLQEEIREYELLKSLPFQVVVEAILQEPVLLENISELLTKLRIAAKKTQEEMADMLGWRQSNLSRFESEKYNSQTIGKVSEYVDALNVWLYLTPALVEHPPRINYEITRTKSEQDIPSMRCLLLETKVTNTSSISGRKDYLDIQTTAIESSLADQLFSPVIQGDATRFESFP